MIVKSFEGKLAVVTGGGTGMGRELAVQLASEGCSVAICDVSAENMAETQRLCEKAARAGTRVSAHLCDVADERQVIAFKDAVVAAHQADHVDLLFNNAGIGGGASVVAGDRVEWERTFGVCWYGVYYCTRAFLPLLVASPEACIVNTSSVNGFWACLGSGIPHTAYSTAKFAVKGFSEALITDLRMHAPHVKVALVMPGHVGTSIVDNTRKIMGYPPPLEMSAEEVAELRAQAKQAGIELGGVDDDTVRQMMHQREIDFRENAPLSSAQAATIILDGVRAGQWRILVGEDARALDQMVRRDPEGAYEPEFSQRIQDEGHLQAILEED
jgi:NAD(P)-dependent dehydrogenase (short-subunit alcohol dehydrogenase family)